MLTNLSAIISQARSSTNLSGLIRMSNSRMLSVAGPASAQLNFRSVETSTAQVLAMSAPPVFSGASIRRSTGPAFGNVARPVFVHVRITFLLCLESSVLTFGHLCVLVLLVRALVFARHFKLLFVRDEGRGNPPSPKGFPRDCKLNLILSRCFYVRHAASRVPMSGRI